MVNDTFCLIKKYFKIFHSNSTRCGRRFAQTNLLKVHEMTHTKVHEGLNYDDANNPILRCNDCEREFKTVSSLKMHLKFKCNGVYRVGRKVYRYKCPVESCGKNYPTRKGTSSHIRAAHGIEIGTLENYCFECNAEFEDYMSHVKQHSCKFECDLCSKRFLSDEKLQEHTEKFHLDPSVQRPFKCNECEASFKSLNHLRQHRGMRHASMGDKKFSCDFCDRKYSFKHILTQHLKTHLAP